MAIRKHSMLNGLFQGWMHSINRGQGWKKIAISIFNEQCVTILDMDKHHWCDLILVLVAVPFLSNCEIKKDCDLVTTKIMQPWYPNDPSIPTSVNVRALKNWLLIFAMTCKSLPVCIFEMTGKSLLVCISGTFLLVITHVYFAEPCLESLSWSLGSLDVSSKPEI